MLSLGLNMSAQALLAVQLRMLLMSRSWLSQGPLPMLACLPRTSLPALCLTNKSRRMLVCLLNRPVAMNRPHHPRLLSSNMCWSAHPLHKHQHQQAELRFEAELLADR